MGRVLLSALPDQKLADYFKRVELKAMTAKTVVDTSKLVYLLHTIRDDGFALLDEELELGLRSIAVGVKNRQNETIAAMNIGVHAVRISANDMIQRFLPILQENARMLGQCL